MRVQIRGAVMVHDGGALCPCHHHLVLLEHAVLNERVQDGVEVLLDDLLADLGIWCVG